MKKKRELSEKQKLNLETGRNKLAEKRKLKMESRQDEATNKTEATEEVKAVSLPEENNKPEITPVETKPTEDLELPKVKRIGGRLWWQVILGLVFFVVAAFIGMAYTHNMSNPFLAFGFILAGGMGVLFVYMGLRKRDEGMQLRVPGQGKKSYPANCLNIYYGWDEVAHKYYAECLKFEQFEPKQIIAKHPQRCLDTGKWYYVQIYDGKLKKFIPFTLSDKQYYSPDEFVNPLHMPASRKLKRPRPTLGEKLRPALLLIAMGILVFLYIVTTPTPGV